MPTTMKWTCGSAVWLVAFVCGATTTINSTNHYLYGANIGWIDAAGDVTNGAVIGQTYASGFMYGANVGWIHLGDGSPDNGTSYSNASSTDYGVNVEPDGDLRGFSYGANIGWVNFEDMGDPSIDLLTGKMSGSAYGANVGWVSLSNMQAFVQTDFLDPGPDSEPDGLPDAWELIYTNDLAGLSGGSDSDGDGATDDAELNAGTNPLDSNSVLAITMQLLDPPMNETDVTWDSVPTRLYRVEQNGDILNSGTWVDSGAGMVPPDPGTETTLTVPLGAPAGAQLFRVEAIPPLTP